MALTALILQQLRSKSPIVDLRLFKDRSYAVGVFLMTVLGFVLYGSLVLLPVMLQTLWGYSSYQAGQAMVPRGIGSMVMMPLVGVLTGFVDSRRLLIIGLAVGGATLVWMGTAEPAGRLLGSVLGPVNPGGRAGTALRAVDHGVDGHHLPGANGSCDQPPQPDAEQTP